LAFGASHFKANREGHPHLLLDKPRGSGKVYEEAEEKYIQMFQLKGGGKMRDSRRREILKAFRLALYRLRAVGEGIFAALKTRLNGSSGI